MTKAEVASVEESIEEPGIRATQATFLENRKRREALRAARRAAMRSFVARAKERSRPGNEEGVGLILVESVDDVSP